MKSQWVISLEGIEIKAYHGVYDFEQENGNDFVVDVNVKLTRNHNTITDLESTINYENLFQIVDEEMKIKSKLLEEVVQRIADKILKTFSSVARVKVSLSKLNPPLTGKCRRAKVTLIQKKKK